MINFIKKFVVFSKKKNGNISMEEINSISEKEAKEYLENCPMDSLLDLYRKENETYLQKGLFTQVDGFIACIGKPGQGKSTLCSAFYKTLYGLDKEVFSISNARLSFTKGLWIIKGKERINIRENIIKDIIDVEGFQVDDLSTWKYIMIVAFIATDIIVVNRSTRLDEVKKILNIIWNSLEKMKQLGLPRILKTIWVQLCGDEELETFEEDMKSIDNSFEKWQTKGISIKSFIVEEVNRKELRKHNGNILDVEDYLEEVKNVFLTIQKENVSESVSSLLKYIDNFNNTLNGKDTFNMDNLKNEIKKDFKNWYLIQKNKKETELLENYTKDKFIPPINSKESFNDFINKQNLDFSFSKENVKANLTFYGSSNEFDKIYNHLMEQEDYKADPSIFKSIYDSLIAKAKVEEQIEMDKKILEQKKLDQEKRLEEEKKLLEKKKLRQQALFDFENKKMEIRKYFSKLKFYDTIYSYSTCEYDIFGPYDDETKREYNNQLKTYYNEQETIKRKEWQDQIERSYHKCIVQSYGKMECFNGHKYSTDNVGCGSCRKKGVAFDNRLLYWVDGDAHYVQCDNCKKVFYIDEKIECGTCEAESYSKIKWKGGWKP